jgi:structure-specific endonuclease subunit SLX1
MLKNTRTSAKENLGQRYKKMTGVSIMSFFVYFLVSDSEATYIGATVDLDHRLRQHNGEIKGGAHATSMKIAKGERWCRFCHVAGFPTWNAALQFEWRWKQLSRTKFPKNMHPVERRIRALKMLLALDRPTTKADLYSEWASGGPQVNIEVEHPFFLLLDG